MNKEVETALTGDGEDRGRVSKREFISRVSKRSGLPVKTVSVVYEAIIEELVLIVTAGHRVMLTGFGTFYRQSHKGHRVQFAEGKSNPVIDDYSVFKFSATRDVNRRLGPPTEDHQTPVLPLPAPVVRKRNTSKSRAKTPAHR